MAKRANELTRGWVSFGTKLPVGMRRAVKRYAKMSKTPISIIVFRALLQCKALKPHLKGWNPEEL